VRNAELRGVIERAAEGVESSREIAVDDRRLLVAARPIEQIAPAASARDAEARVLPGGPRLPVVVAFADLTELRRLEGVRRDFVANVSHELKTPLTSIRGYVETLLGDPDLPADMHNQFLGVIHKNAERLQGIIDDLLDLSRLESGGWRPTLIRLDPMSLVREVWAAFEPRATLQKVEFIVAGEAAAVLADAGWLRQVLTNLYDNALRYTHAGGRITARVTPLTHTNGGVGSHRVAIDVIDTGSGIPGDALPRIFERFYRVDPARSRAEGGTGLGLSIVKHLVESMGGDVAAESELGKGTTIRLRLPAP
jgi:signal transduction histidine kinase